jgi:hypothetical protein
MIPRAGSERRRNALTLSSLLVLPAAIAPP